MAHVSEWVQEVSPAAVCLCTPGVSPEVGLAPPHQSTILDHTSYPKSDTNPFHLASVVPFHAPVSICPHLAQWKRPLMPLSP